jgi:outer membrane lipoprotein-sorting protein
MMKTTAFSALALIGTLLVAPLTGSAETAEEKGLAIAIEGDKRDQGYIDSTSDMRMILRNRAGKESVRTMRALSLEVEGDGDKSLSIFDEPADVKGTASLTWAHSDKPDEQWLYLPARKRVKRIFSKNKSGPFMGSEFAFEDIGSQEVDKYTYKYLRDEQIDGADAFVVERVPVDKNSGYKRQISWIEKERYVALKIDYYDRKDTLLKTLVASEYQQYLDKFWRPSRMEMTNHQSGKSTTLTFENYQFQTGLKDSDFNKNALKRLR